MPFFLALAEGFCRIFGVHKLLQLLAPTEGLGSPYGSQWWPLAIKESIGRLKMLVWELNKMFLWLFFALSQFQYFEVHIVISN